MFSKMGLGVFIRLWNRPLNLFLLRNPRDTSAHLVRKHLEDIGLDGDIAQYNEISGLSGGKRPLVDALRMTSSLGCFLGQKIKLVIAACLWNNPQVWVTSATHIVLICDTK